MTSEKKPTNRQNSRGLGMDRRFPSKEKNKNRKKRTIGYLEFKSLRCHPTNRRTRAESQHRELKKKVSVDYARETGIWFWLLTHSVLRNVFPVSRIYRNRPETCVYSQKWTQNVLDRFIRIPVSESIKNVEGDTQQLWHFRAT